MHHNHHEIRVMAREQEQDRLREAHGMARHGTRLRNADGVLKVMLSAIAAGVGLGPGGRLRAAFCRVLGTLMRRVGFGLVRSGRRLARIA